MKLADYLTSKDLSDADFALAIECDRTTVSRLRRGITRPTWAQAERIRDATQGAVTPNDFLQDAAPAEEGAAA